MCGICGKLNFDHDEPIASELIVQMTEAIQHRGPDGVGHFVDGPIGFGHRRLSIIDLATGDQPMCNEDQTVWVVYNGEIYNFRELRAKLESKGHHFKSTSDTEVIVHLYEEFGCDAVQQLRGMFAFALWDSRRRRLMLARDRVGIKPLYYTNTGRALAFGSELKCLLRDPDVVRDVNVRAIDRFLTYYYSPGAETAVDKIFKLLPGHYLTVMGGQVTTKQYWDLRFVQEAPRGFDDAVIELRELLRQTVKDHMISDVPVGVLLSGGVDSTAILRYAAESSEQRLHSFTIGFSGEGVVDERPYARLAADRFETQHAAISITSDQFRDFLPVYVWHMEEPVCEPPAVALYHVSRLARETGVKVLLSGEGGDEAFGGYQNYRNLLLFEQMKAVLGPAKGLLTTALDAAAWLGSHRARTFSGLVAPQLSTYYLSRTATPLTPFNQTKRALYREDFVRHLETYADTPSVTADLFDRTVGWSLLDRMLYIDSKTWLPDDLLIKADKMTMATSVELRVPFLDFRVMEFAASLPQHYKVRGMSLKRVLKAALATEVPAKILDRKKAGFPVPYDRWLRNELREFVGDTVLGPTARLTRYFRRESLNRLVSSFFAQGVASKEVFSLIVLELWLQQFTAPATDRCAA